MNAPISIGEQYALAGAATAAAHAGASWQAAASEFARQFLREVAPFLRKPFQAFHIRQYAEGCGLSPAPDARAWGHIMRHLCKAKLIKSVGIGRSPDPVQHYGYVSEWELVQCSTARP